MEFDRISEEYLLQAAPNKSRTFTQTASSTAAVIHRVSYIIRSASSWACRREQTVGKYFTVCFMAKREEVTHSAYELESTLEDHQEVRKQWDAFIIHYIKYFYEKKKRLCWLKCSQLLHGGLLTIAGRETNELFYLIDLDCSTVNDKPFIKWIIQFQMRYHSVPSTLPNHQQSPEGLGKPSKVACQAPLKSTPVWRWGGVLGVLSRRIWRKPVLSIRHPLWILLNLNLSLKCMSSTAPIVWVSNSEKFRIGGEICLPFNSECGCAQRNCGYFHTAELLMRRSTSYS